MSDAITDGDRDDEAYELKRMDVNKAAQKLKEYRSFVVEYETIKAKLIKLGFRVEEIGSSVKIWKEI